MMFESLDNWLNLNDVIFNYYFLIGGLFLCYLIYRILHTVLGGNNFMQTRYRIHGHTWRSIQCNKSIPYNIHCTICRKLMLPVVGLFCECCAVSACKRCHKTADKKYRCKQIAWSIQKPFCHQWVNVGSTRGDNSGQGEEEVFRYFCSWCQRIRSANSFVAETEGECETPASTMASVAKARLAQARARIAGAAPPRSARVVGSGGSAGYLIWLKLVGPIWFTECDFQKYRNIIIPPTCVEIQKGSVKKIKPLSNEEWEPLIILANRKSGSNRTDEVLSLFRGLLNPIQVVDISVTSPEKVMQWLPERCRLLVAGGDGTVAWVLNALTAAPQVKAVVGILPMGTGNDLSRVLGWGPGCTSTLDAEAIISSVRDASLQPLDRWKVTIKPKRSRLGRLRSERVMYAYNYASIGVDAQVALDFHRARTQFLYLYANRTLNYIAYAFLGVGRALDAGACGSLERRLRVTAAGRTLPLPPLQALVALNIPSWGAGVDLWSMGPEDEVDDQSISDGKLEVVGISSSIHIARLQCGLAEPYRFTQCSNLMIELEGSCAMQVDGEPWMQGPATIHIEPAGQSLVLRSTNHTSDEVL